MCSIKWNTSFLETLTQLWYYTTTTLVFKIRAKSYWSFRRRDKKEKKKKSCTTTTPSLHHSSTFLVCKRCVCNYTLNLPTYTTKKNVKLWKKDSVLSIIIVTVTRFDTIKTWIQFVFIQYLLSVIHLMSKQFYCHLFVYFRSAEFDCFCI